MRIVCMDYYTAPPIPEVDICYNKFHGQTVAEVPVIRIYGSTLAGQKTCMHVHGAFPYLYVPYDSDLPQNLQEGYTYVRLLASAIEKALKLSGGIGAKRQHVHSCSLVRAKKFYGYHPSDQLFIKIVLYYPHEVTRVAALLMGGGILSRVFQPHESHIPYLLQFLIDHNLYGMGHLHLSKLKFRDSLPDNIPERSCLFRDVASKLVTEGKDDSVALGSQGISSGPNVEPETPSPFIISKICEKQGNTNLLSVSEEDRRTPVDNHLQLWLRSTVTIDWLWSLAVADYTEGSPFQGNPQLKRQSTCQLEGDTTVNEILNGHQLMYTSLSQAGPEVKMVQSLIPIWEEEFSRSGFQTFMEKFEDQKPPPWRVLKTLLHGHEYENVLSKLVAECEKKADCPNSSPVMSSETKDMPKNYRHEMQERSNSPHLDKGIICERSRDMHEELIMCTQAANGEEPTPEIHVSSSNGLLHAGEDIRMLAAGDQGFNVTEVLVDENFVRSQLEQSTELKDSDNEMIELLKWLASSQAADDLNAEDGEGEELVFSQLLHSDSIERVLERAHSGYLDVSQKECEDILNSMEDVEKFQCRDEGKHSDHSSKQAVSEFSDHASSPEDMIPQLDGTGDDLAGNPESISVAKEKKGRKDIKALSNASNNISKVVSSSSSEDGLARKQALWGSLPLATSSKAQKDSSTTYNMYAGCAFALTDSNNATILKNKANINQNVDALQEENCSLKLENTAEVKEQSLRDLMRKKRSRRPEISESKCLISTKKTTMDRHTQHDVIVNCEGNFNTSEKVYQKSRNTNQDLNCHASRQSHFSVAPENCAFIQPFELNKCSEKYRNKVENEIFSRYGALPLVKQGTTGNSLEACKEKHSQDVMRDICNEEKLVYLESGKVLQDEGRDCDEQKQEEADCDNNLEEVVNEMCKDTCIENLEFVDVTTEDHQDLAPEEYKKCLGPFTVIPKESVSHMKISGDSVASKETEGKEEPIYPELQTGLIHASGSGTSMTRNFPSGVQLTNVSNKIHCSSELNSHSISDYDFKKQMSPDASLRKYSEDGLIPLAFHRQPPTKEQIQIGFGDHSLTPVEHSEPYYGNMEDIPVKSKEAKYLHPFFMERTDRVKSSDEKSYIDKEFWGPCHGSDTVVGIPTLYQNDGSVLYLLTPSQPPPSACTIIKWLSPVDNYKPLTMPNAGVADSDTNGKQNEGLLNALGNFKVSSSEYNEPAVFMSGSDNPQFAETYVQLKQPASAGLNGSENLISMDKDCIVDSSFNNYKCEGMPSGASKQLQIHGISEKLQYGDGNSSVNSPIKRLPDAKLHKETAHQELPRIWQDISQISAPSPAGAKQTPLSQTGFRDPATVGAGQQMTLMSIEIHAESRGDLRPDPRYDAINFIVVAIQEDSNDAAEILVLLRDEKANAYNRNVDGVLGCGVFAVKDEKTLFYLFTELICIYDPDILMGWEIQGGSIGYLAERAAYVGIGLLKKISRTPLSETKLETVHLEDIRRDESKDSLEEFPTEDLELQDTIIEDEWGRTHGSGIHVGGRIVLNLWRIMRGELKLRIYSLEAVAEAVLRRKVPKIPWRTLSWWFLSGPGRARFRCIEHIIDRAKLNLAIMDQLDMINRTSELARVFGIDFFSVHSRGSQYRVESMMLRLAHTQNFLVISPSRQQVASQPAMECLPLVMEPESKFYADPVVVLDFQSLYPSMIIAYNLCFSTSLGKVAPGKTKVLGVTSYTVSTKVLSEMKDHLFITPNGIMFVPPEVRPGVLPRLLQELLSTRIMVKTTMKKLTPDQRVLQRVFNARQLALKLIANVTYGYTAAGFSGRMPCAELADSIVQCGRRTLEDSINFVNSKSVWNARVVYGDTDSMFVLLKGRTREEAFRIGQEIASAITARNPHPVTLKMEKVYNPCVLLTKKRYVGYSYESPTQCKPIFDAKGIETVRRDSCPAVAKILEQSLRILFESRDLSGVKTYLYRQWKKIISGRVSLQDFIFAKEVRLGTYSMKASSLPPAAIVATKSMRVDPRAEPHYGERIRYVVVHGEPGARLVDMVVDPLELLDINTPHRLHDIYYITKQIIPALQRVFSLVDVDLKLWYAEMPRPARSVLAKRHPIMAQIKGRLGTEGYDAKKYQKGPANRSTIDRYYLSQHCVVCGELIRASTFVCDLCSMNQCTVAMTITGRTSKLEKESQHLDAVCRHCGGGDWFGEKGIKCVSLDCSVFFERRKVQKELLTVSQVSTELGFYPPVELF